MSLVPLIPLLQGNTAIGCFVFGFLEPEVIEILRKLSTGAHYIGIVAPAARVGWIEVLRENKEKLTAIDLRQLLEVSAKSGQIETMRLLKGWGATNYNGALAHAASSGNIEAIELAKSWGANLYDSAFMNAAFAGHIKMMELLGS